MALQIPQNSLVRKTNSTNSDDSNLKIQNSSTTKGRIYVLPKDFLMKSKTVQLSEPKKLPRSCVLKKVNSLPNKPNSVSVPSVRIAPSAPTVTVPQNIKTIKTIAVKPIQRNSQTNANVAKQNDVIDAMKLKSFFESEDVVAEEICIDSRKLANYKKYLNLEIQRVEKKVKKNVTLDPLKLPSTNLTTHNVFADFKENDDKDDDDDEEDIEEMAFDDDDEFLSKKISNFKCEICHRGFDTKTPYYMHIKRVHRDHDDLYQCTMCPEKFKFHREIIRHVRDHRGQHRNGKLICDICGKTKKSIATLEDHRRTHFDERLYVCHICSASFKTKYQMKSHINRHSGIKKYKCNECDAAFFDCIDFKRHLVKHGLIEKNFHCQMCDKSFYERKLLKYHLKKAHKICDGEELKYLPEIEDGSKKRFKFLPKAPKKPSRKPKTGRRWGIYTNRPKNQKLETKETLKLNAEKSNKKVGVDNYDHIKEEPIFDETEIDIPMSDFDEVIEFDAQTILDSINLDESDISNQPEEIKFICGQLADIIVTLNQLSNDDVCASLLVVQKILKTIHLSTEQYNKEEIKFIYRQIGIVVAEVQKSVRKVLEEESLRKVPFLPIKNINELEKNLKNEKFNEEFVKFFTAFYRGTSPYKLEDIQKVLSDALLYKLARKCKSLKYSKFTDYKCLMSALYNIWFEEFSTYKEFEDVMRKQIWRVILKYKKEHNID